MLTGLDCLYLVQLQREHAKLLRDLTFPLFLYPQVIIPVRSGQGYVYELPSKHQKDAYDIPPIRPLQGVGTNKSSSRADRAQKVMNFYQTFMSKASSLISERKYVLIRCCGLFTDHRRISKFYLMLTKIWQLTKRKSPICSLCFDQRVYLNRINLLPGNIFFPCTCCCIVDSNSLSKGKIIA